MQNGIFYVVATPIGNLDDLGLRAQRLLGDAELVLAEDTRHSVALLKHYGIHARQLRSCHEHNERCLVAGVLDRLRAGALIVLISDAGTPLISDPGFPLVRAVHEAGLAVRAVPGPCAVSAALSVSGLPAARFCFEGFPPSRRAARRSLLQSLRYEARTLVFFEAPRRLLFFLQDAIAVLGAERPASLVKELSKVYEQARTGSLSELREWLATDPDRCRGEFTVLIAGCQQAEMAECMEARRVLRILQQRLPVRETMRLAAEITGWSRNDLYALYLENQSGN